MTLACMCVCCRLREALTYLAHAYETNASLLKKGEKWGVDKSTIAVYRRKCLTVSTEAPVVSLALGQKCCRDEMTTRGTAFLFFILDLKQWLKPRCKGNWTSSWENNQCINFMLQQDVSPPSSPRTTSTTQALNQRASQLFSSGDETGVEEGVAVMNEVVIPCLHLMSRDSSLSQEDRDAMESIRSHWCCCLGKDMDGEMPSQNTEIG